MEWEFWREIGNERESEVFGVFIKRKRWGKRVGGAAGGERWQG